MHRIILICPMLCLINVCPRLVHVLKHKTIFLHVIGSVNKYQMFLFLNSSEILGEVMNYLKFTHRFKPLIDID